MTIDERVEDLIAKLPCAVMTSATAPSNFRKRLQLALLEVARDQRAACAEAVLAVSNVGSTGNIYTAIEAGAAHAAVMNANLK